MIEQMWLAAVDPRPMLDLMSGSASERKLRLFAVACCRRKWKYFTDERCRHAVDVSECFADDSDWVGNLNQARSDARLAYYEWRAKQGRYCRAMFVARAALSICRADRTEYAHVATLIQSVPVDSARAKAVEAQSQAQLVRDLFGNPFAPPAVDAAWLTSTVLALAHGIYDGKAFDRLPVLADALADAGCESADLLDHCRGDGPHVRGCWVIDLILGKV